MARMVGLIKVKSARGKVGFVSNGGLIVELGFMSNAAEFAVLQAKYWLKPLQM